MITFCSAPQRRITPGNLCRGFTLSELIIVVAILGIISTLFSNMARLAARQELSTQANEIVASLNLARSAAIFRKTRITMCQSTLGVACEKGTDWGKGWLVFTDPDNDRVIDPGEQVIQFHPGLNERTSLHWKGSLGSNYYLGFKKSGSSTKAGSFWICSDVGILQEARRIVVARSGRVRTEPADRQEIATYCN